MWVLLAMVASISFALTGYIDEYLARNNTAAHFKSIHARIGGVILTSSLGYIASVVVLYLITPSVYLPTPLLIQSIMTGIPALGVLIVYLYLLDRYPVYQVMPLFQLTSLWLALWGLSHGSPISALGFAGILLMSYGAYVLDTGTFKFALPTSLIYIMIPCTLAWAAGLQWIAFLMKSATYPNAVIFWQDVCALLIGIIFYLFIPVYREGLRARINQQKHLFVYSSVANELLSQIGYVSKYLALAFTPVVAYANALSNVEGIFLLALLFVFPINNKRFHYMHGVGALLIILGGLFVEFSA